jgi:hypothetical protein
MADRKQDSYPIVREMPPPDFLVTKFGTVTALYLATLQALGTEEPKLDEATIAKAFPDFISVFKAEDDALKAVLSEYFEAIPDVARPATEAAFLVEIKRLMIFADGDGVKEAIRPYFKRLIDSLPRTLDELEVSGGGRDVLDPFIVAFDQLLLSRNSLPNLLNNLLAHKCLMKLEDLIGHLHQEVLGRARGNDRISEPDGAKGEDGKRNKELWHEVLNPYPGADVRHGQSEFYQIKNKTGSAKGSDGEKLGRQFQILSEKYPDSQGFYVSMVGKTLAGHRSMGAFLRTAPNSEVLVGLTAFQQLGGHRDTPNVLLDLYVEVFKEVCDELDFDFVEISAKMAEQWKTKHGEGDPARRLLFDTITPLRPEDQSSQTYGRNRRSK